MGPHPVRGNTFSMSNDLQTTLRKYNIISVMNQIPK